MPGDEGQTVSCGPTSEFLPPERDDKSELIRQKGLLFKDSLTRIFFDGFPDGGFILNDKRQILAINRALSQRFGSFKEDSLLGLRPGEALGCKYVHETTGGCGTTSFCRYCGAAQVLFQVRMGKPAQEQCYVITEIESDALDLLVWGTPFKIDDKDFTLFALADISSERRRQALERMFFHDALNTVSGLLGSIEMLALKVGPELKQRVQSIKDSGNALANDIKAQRQLFMAESGKLETVYSKFLSKDLLSNVIQRCGKLMDLENRTVVLHPDSQDFVLDSDVSLLKRILNNLVKNAMEASGKGDQITVRARQSENSYIFSVHNNSFIGIDAQHNLFKRSFSTKGVGRGLGLYSVRLLTEKYLKGTANFESDPDQGTTFSIILPRE